MSAFDLNFVMDHPEGIVLAASGDYAGWTVASTSWVVFDGDSTVTVEGPLDLSPYESGVSATATATLTSPDGTQQVTLTGTPLYSQNNGSTIYSDAPDGDPFGIIVAGHEATGSMVQLEYSNGELRQVVATLLDGTETGFEFSFTTGMLERIYEYDAGDVHDWEYKLDNYTSDGLYSSQIVYDNGVNSETSYNNGQIEYVYTQDIQDVFAYTEILAAYDNGELYQISHLYDDGVSSVSDYQNDVIQTTQIFDNDNAHSYDFKYTIYQDGVRQTAVTEMDDGRNYTRDYQEGEIQLITGQDYQDAVSWDEQYTIYQDGDLVQRVTLYDDGRELNISYTPNMDSNGSTIEQRVMIDHNDAHSWTEQGKYYQDGVVAFDQIIFDDGVTRETTYDDGIRSSRVTTDVNDTRSYETIEQYFDNSGTLRYQNTSLDDGREIEREYSEEGAFEFQVITDFNDAVSYETQTSFYDDGTIVARDTQYDNGVFRTEFFDETGSRVADERMDNADAFNWHSISRTYENGQVTSTDIIYDDDVMG